MTPRAWWLLGGGLVLLALAGGGVAVYVTTRGRRHGKRVFNLQNLDGCDARLLAFVDWWELHGSFPVTFAADSGVRTDEAHQADLFLTGKSNARTLADTAHGRGGGIDGYPAVLNEAGDGVSSILVDSSAETLRRYREWGEAGKRCGLVWGGDWTLRDYPHLELPDWKRLPYPPKRPSVA